MYAHTLLHGPGFRRDCVNFVLLLQRKLNASLPPKAKILACVAGYCKPWYSGFFPLWSLYCESWLLVSSYVVYAEEEIMTENSVQNYYTDFSMVITHKKIRHSTKRLANISCCTCTWQQMLVEYTRKFVEVFWTCDTHSRSVIAGG